MSSFRLLAGGELLPVVVNEIRTATSCISVMMFEWGWYSGNRTGTVQDVNRELCKRGDDGLDIRVLLCGAPRGSVLYRINRSTGVHLVKRGIKVRFGSTGIALHAKVWLFDGERFIVGSHNLSSRSVTVNAELSVFVDDSLACVEGLEWFNSYWDRGLSGGLGCA